MITKNGIEYAIENEPAKGVKVVWYVSYQTSDFENVRVICGTKKDALSYIKGLKPSQVNMRSTALPYVGWNYDTPDADINQERGIFRNIWTPEGRDYLQRVNGVIR